MRFIPLHKYQSLKYSVYCSVVVCAGCVVYAFFYDRCTVCGARDYWNGGCRMHFSVRSLLLLLVFSPLTTLSFFSVSYSYFSYICKIQDYAVASYIHSHTSYYVLAIYTRSHSISVLMWEFNHKKKKVFIRSILFCCCCCCCVFFSFVWCALSVFVPHVYIFAAVLHIYESVSSRNAFR